MQLGPHFTWGAMFSGAIQICSIRCTHCQRSSAFFWYERAFPEERAFLIAVGNAETLPIFAYDEHAIHHLSAEGTIIATMDEQAFDAYLWAYHACSREQ